MLQLPLPLWGGGGFNVENAKMANFRLKVHKNSK
jgi:hypothetical protein